MAVLVALLLAFLAYLALLFLVAYRVETHRGWLAKLPAHPGIYALSLTVFFTGWGYFSSGSSTLDVGLPFTATYVGASLTLLFGWPILRRAIRIAKIHRVTTLPGLLSVRFGHSFWLTSLVAMLLLVGTLPYLALQISALGFALKTIVADPALLDPREEQGVVLLLTFVLALFAIAFGVRRADPTQGNPGIVVSLAIDGIVKLFALLAVAFFVYANQPQLFAMLSHPDAWPHLLLGSTPQNSYANWLGFLLLSMVAMPLLPHMYHLLVVESSDAQQVVDVRGVLPAYSWLAHLLTLLIALAGVAIGLRGPENQIAILVIPLLADQPLLLLIAYLGGIAASAGMAIAVFVALTNLITADLVLPLLSRMTTRLGPLLIPLRWLILLGVAGLAFVVWDFTDVTFLSQFGLISFVAAAQLAPAFFLGLCWARLQRGAVLWGIAAGALAWLYTSFLPSFAEASPLIARWVAQGPFGWAFLRPHSLFGLQGLDPAVHAVYWSTLLNLTAIAVYTLIRPAAKEEIAHVEALFQGKPSLSALYHRFIRMLSFPELEAVLVKYLGEEQAREHMERIRLDLEGLDLPPESKLLMARNALQRALSGPLGASVAADIVRREFPVSDKVVPDAFEAYQKLELMLRTSREDLASRLRELSLINAISERLVAARDRRQVMEAAIGQLWEGLHFERVGAVIVERDESALCYLRGFQHFEEGPFAVTEDSAMAEALRHRQLRVLSAGQSDDPILVGEGAKTLIYVPLVFENENLGVLICGMVTTALVVSPSLRSVLRSVANTLAISLSDARHREEEERLRRQLATALANLGDAVVVFDSQRRIILTNPAFQRLGLFAASEDPRGRDLITLILSLGVRDLSGQPLTRERLPACLALAGETAHLTVRLDKGDGTERILSITSVPVKDAQGRVVQAVSVYRDITELYHLKEDLERRVQERTDELAQERDLLKAANDKLGQALEELRNLDRLKGTFVNAISHDLRIPLTGIAGYAEFLEDEIGGPLAPQQREFAREIQRAVARMARLLNDLLDFARVEAGKFTIEPSEIELEGLLRDTAASFRPTAEKKGLRLVLDLAEGLPRVWADPGRVTQIVSNLLSNAVKFTPEGGEVRLKAYPEDAVVATEVTDTGQGIPPEAMPHLFERFFQTEAGVRAGGTGLGLPIAKGLVEAQGGTMTVESVEGVGSTFRFTLPKAVPGEP